METLERINIKPFPCDDLRTILVYAIVDNCLILSNNEISINMGEIIGEFNYMNYIQNFSHKHYNGGEFYKVLLYCDINNIELKVVDSYYVYKEYRFNFIDCRFDEFLKIVKQNFIII